MNGNFKNCAVRRMFSPIRKLRKQNEITIKKNIRNESERKKTKVINVNYTSKTTIK
jgi:hypothetical protein